MKKIIIYCFVILLAKASFSQEKFTISGTITDAATGESLIGANVYTLDFERGVTTNNYGFYSFTLSASDTVGVAYSFIGYEPQIKKITLNQDVNLHIEMTPASSALDEIVISAQINDDNVSKPQMGVIDIPTSKIKELPALLGEVDVLKIIQLLPGVQSGNEGSTGFHVRGGNADQNLVQLDEAIVYNPNHLFGLMSSFNARAINNVTLIKGGFPAQYGGRLSSILDISMKEGNNKETNVEGGIGLITSQLTIEGPLAKDKASFIISGRRTYLDLLLKLLTPKSVTRNYAFYDLNAKVNWQLGPKDRIFLSAFKGNDDAHYSDDGLGYNILFGNETATLRWNHIFGPKLFMNTSLIGNNYNQNIFALQANARSQVVSGIKDYSAKVEFQYFPEVNHTVRFGAEYLDHTFRSSGDSRLNSNFGNDPGVNIDSIPIKEFGEFAFYVNDEIRLSERFSTSLGLRVPGFFDSESSYYRIEPRASLQFGIDETTSIKASYAVMNQFIHLIPSSTAAVPTDIWVPSSRQTKPQFSQQYSLGVFKNFQNNHIESNVEVYYKTMDNEVLFREGNQLIQSLDVDDLLVRGKGWSYGAEFFVNKKAGRFSGWAAYALSWTYQEFPELNFGKKFPFRYDRRHDLSLVGTYQLNDRWTFSGVFVLSSGSAYTVPVGRVSVANGGTLFEGNYYIFESRNNTRLNAYHRLDLSATYRKERKIFGKKYMSEWVFSLYNTYSRQNPYYIYFDIDPLTEKPRATQVSLLPIIPGIAYNFKF